MEDKENAVFELLRLPELEDKTSEIIELCRQLKGRKGVNKISFDVVFESGYGMGFKLESEK